MSKHRSPESLKMEARARALAAAYREFAAAPDAPPALSALADTAAAIVRTAEIRSRLDAAAAGRAAISDAETWLEGRTADIAADASAALSEMATPDIDAAESVLEKLIAHPLAQLERKYERAMAAIAAADTAAWAWAVQEIEKIHRPANPAA